MFGRGSGRVSVEGWGRVVQLDVPLLFRPTIAVLLVAFVVTFVVTRIVTHAIRSGRGPFRDTVVGGVHIHHQVYGILMLLVTGTIEFAYRPVAPWEQVLAVAFGVGAALTLDEFALWLRLDDVYWGVEGRRSVDAVLLAVVVGLLMMTGFSPFDDAGAGELVALAATAFDLVFAVVAILKGRIFLGVVGIMVPVVALVAALRLARPRSPYARRFYPAGSRRLRRAQRRFPVGRRHRWDPLVDMLAGVPHAVTPEEQLPAG